MEEANHVMHSELRPEPRYAPLASPPKRAASVSMPKAVLGKRMAPSPWRLLTVPAGTLVKCDASIKAIILSIDAEERHEIVVEDLDEEHVLIKESRLEDLKRRLAEVPPSQRKPRR